MDVLETDRKSSRPVNGSHHLDNCHSIRHFLLFRMSRRTTLFVAGINPNTRAKDLAYEFERYGRLVRCDIPAPRPHAKPYAFVEFEDYRDAEDAYHEMHGVRIDGYTLNIQWARNAPSRSWRFDDPRGGARRRSRSRSRSPRRPSRRHSRSRSRSPKAARRSRSRSPRPRSVSPKAGHDREREPHQENGDRMGDRSPRDDRREERRDGSVSPQTR
ncbi:hypothetical protein BKA69DRAFT_1084336 [Paraphysoderma sedebokerense]|nr:hypothetical protein BKA69DRAFT_1084336 [Paraphysoderma sedebokerense]